MKKFSLIIVLFSSVCFAQAVAKIDSSNQESVQRIRLPLTLNTNRLILPDTFFTDFSNYPELQFLAMEKENSLNIEPDFKNIQKNLLKDFKQSMKWQADYSLGVVGKYLGYAMAGAAAGLAVTHVVKYKDKYFKRK